MTQSGAQVSPDLMNLLVKTLQPLTAMYGSLSVAVREGSPGNFKIEVDGDRPKILWIRYYYTTASSIGDPQLADTPYMDSDGILLVDDLHDPSFVYTTDDIGLPTGTRWVQAVAWGLYANSASLVHNSGKHEFVPPTTTSSTSTSTSSSTTESTSTSSSTSSSSTTESTSTSSSTTESTSTSSSTTESTSTSSSTTDTSSSTTGSTTSTTTQTSSTTTDTSTSSTTEAPSTTTAGPGLVQWTWQETKAGLAWVLTSPKPKGSHPQPPEFRGKKVGDTAHTQLP